MTTANRTQNIPDDVFFTEIIPRLDFKKQVCCRSVCRSWRDSSHLSPLPWLCVSPAPTTTTATQSITLADLSNGLNVAGSHDQYMIITSPTFADPVIRNCFTGQTFPLPTTMSLPQISSRSSIKPARLRLGRISSPPDGTTGPSCMAAAVDPIGNLFVCRLGIDESWTSLPMPHCCFEFDIYGITDLVFFQGKLVYTFGHQAFHFVTLQSVLESRMLLGVIHMEIPQKKSFPDLGRSGRLQASYMINDSSVELLVVTLYKMINEEEEEKESFIFRVHRLVGTRELVPVDDLGDRMLFVGRGCSRSWSGEESPDGFFTKNCVYYVASCDCSVRSCANGLRPCPRDKPRNHRLLKWSVPSNEVIDSLLVSSITVPTWVTPAASL